MVSISDVLPLPSAKPMYVVVAEAVNLFVCHSPSPALVTLNVALNSCVPPEDVPTFSDTSLEKVRVRTIYSLFIIVCIVCVTSALDNCNAPVTEAPEFVVSTLNGDPDITVQYSMLESNVPFFTRFLGRNINESQSTFLKSEGKLYS